LSIELITTSRPLSIYGAMRTDSENLNQLIRQVEKGSAMSQSAVFSYLNWQENF